LFYKEKIKLNNGVGIDFYSPEIYHSAEKLAEVLRTRGWKLTTAESCTGGGLGHALTALAGSSNWYLGGVVAYSNEFKSKFLAVPESLIDEFGAVSKQVAIAMASGLMQEPGASSAISVTGIAGPEGGSEAKPVGLVWLGSDDPERGPRAYQLDLTGSRDEIRHQAIAHAINFFLLDL
jgi:nicotinamide-nucleotide amidase